MYGKASELICIKHQLQKNLFTKYNYFIIGLRKDCKVGEHFYCDTLKTKCIDLSKLCNDQYDCPNQTDEGPGCKAGNCQVNNGGCSHLCYQTPYSGNLSVF